MWEELLRIAQQKAEFLLPARMASRKFEHARDATGKGEIH